MPSLFARQNPLDDARQTISSWDNCMAKSYCKWPVIVAIVVVSLILISIITCIARCICCGAECACCCFRCCTCCGGGSGGRSGHKRMKSDAAPYGGAQPPYSPAANPYAQAHAVAPRLSMDTRPVNQQYRSNAMPTYGAVKAPERPQFATFDSTRAVVNEDALPAMPTWKDGRDVHVEVEEAVPEKKGDVELNQLDHNGSVTSGSTAATAAAGGARKRPVSPVRDDYGFPPGYQNPNEGFASAVASRKSPGSQRGPYAQPDGYRRVSPGASVSPGNGGQNQQYGRQSPGHHQAYDSYNQQDHYTQHDQHTHQNYLDDPHDRYNSPAPPSQHYTDRYNSPAPPPQHIDRYNSPAPPPQPIDRYNSPAPPPQTDYSAPAPALLPYDNFAPPTPPSPTHTPQRSHTPAYTPSESTLYEPPSATPAPAYPGQQTYAASPGHTAYQAFHPGAQQGGQTGRGRREGGRGVAGY